MYSEKCPHCKQELPTTRRDIPEHNAVTYTIDCERHGATTVKVTVNGQDREVVDNG